MKIAQAIVLRKIAKRQWECCFMVLFSAVLHYLVDLEMLVTYQLGKVFREIFKVVLCSIEVIINKSRVNQTLNFPLDLQTKGPILFEPAYDL